MHVMRNTTAGCGKNGHYKEIAPFSTSKLPIHYQISREQKKAPRFHRNPELTAKNEIQSESIIFAQAYRHYTMKPITGFNPAEHAGAASSTTNTSSAQQNAPRGYLSGHVVEATTAQNSGLQTPQPPQPSHGSKLDSASLSPIETSPLSKSGRHDNRSMLRDLFFAPPVDKVHFGRFCAAVEMIFIQECFHCDINAVAKKDLARFTQEKYDEFLELFRDTKPARLTTPTRTQSAAIQHNKQHIKGYHTLTPPPANRAKPELIERLGNLFPQLVSSSMLKLMARTLNQDCELLKACQLDQLIDLELMEFIRSRVTARAETAGGTAQKMLRNEPLSRDEMIRLFSPAYYDTAEAIALADDIERHKTQKPPLRLYRVGAFTSNEDEMGRAKNHKLKLPIFEPGQANHQKAAYGYGLYTAGNATSCQSYLKAEYNKNKPVTLLEITSNEEARVHESYASPFYSEKDYETRAIAWGRCHAAKSIIKTKNGYFLIKDPECIKSVKAFHYSMDTKIHVPFTREEIHQHSLTPKIVSIGEYAATTHVDTLRQCQVTDILGVESGIRDVLKCQSAITQECAESRKPELKTYYQAHWKRVKNQPPITDHEYTQRVMPEQWQPHEVKFYIPSAAGDSFIRVKPAAPSNKEPSWHEQVMPTVTVKEQLLEKLPASGSSFKDGSPWTPPHKRTTFTEFHVQYHRPNPHGRQGRS